MAIFSTKTLHFPGRAPKYQRFWTLSGLCFRHGSKIFGVFFCRAFLHLPDAKFWFQSAYGRSTSSSPKGMSAPSLTSTGCARMAASAARAVHLRASARLAAARVDGARSRARALASRRSSANAPPLNRPPTSRPNGVSAALARGCLRQRQPGPVGTWPGLPVALQGAHECRVDRDLRSLP